MSADDQRETEAQPAQQFFDPQRNDEENAAARAGEAQNVQTFEVGTPPTQTAPTIAAA